MARARFIRPEFFDDEKVGAVPFGARLLFECMWIHCDIRGVCEWSAVRFRGLAFRFDDGVTAEQVESWKCSLQEQAMLCVFEADGKQWCFLPHFTTHQSFTDSEIKSGRLNPDPPESIAKPRLRSGYRHGTSTSHVASAPERSTQVRLTEPAPAPEPETAPTTPRDDAVTPSSLRSWMDWRLTIGRHRVYLDREGNSETHWAELYNRSGWDEFTKAWEYCAAKTTKKVFLSNMLEVLK